MSLAKRDHATETLLFDRADEPLGISVEIRTLRWQPNRLDTATRQDLAEDTRVQANADARVPPRWILDRHPHHEVGHLAWRYRPASTSAGAAVVHPGNQPPVPAETRVRRDDTGDLRQNPPAEFLASHRESTALGVGQAKWTWAKLLPEDPILLPEIIDHVFLVAVHPASGREYEEAQSVGHSLRLLGAQPLAPTLFRRFANLGRFVAPYGISVQAACRPECPSSCCAPLCCRFR